MPSAPAAVPLRRPSARDLHPLVSDTGVVEYRVMRGCDQVVARVDADVLSARYGLPAGPFALLRVYEAHRAEIDRSVLRKVAASRAACVHLSEGDLHPPVAAVA